MSFTSAIATGVGTGAAVILNRKFVSSSSPIHIRTTFFCEFSSNLILRFEFFFSKSVEASSPTPPLSELRRRHRYPKRKIGLLLFFEFMFALLLSANSL
ncbi:uncharacterized protein DS421_20g707370 [Arachis hypogaea]|nr:uncharacterized protein DS421_20g707370 [Arachis hypogaea]